MDIVISVLVEILMDVVGKSRTDAEDRIESIRPPSPLRIATEILEGCLFLLERIRIRDRTDKLDACSIKLKRLLCFWSDLQNTFD